MFGSMKKLFIFVMVFSLFVGCFARIAYAEAKIGYVDIRKAFYEYEKTKALRNDVEKKAEEYEKTREEKIKELSKLRDEVDLLEGKAKAAKEDQINGLLVKLQAFDRDERQKLMNSENEMYKAGIEDIAKAAQQIGAQESYDFILDSRNVMYAKETFDLTDKVVVILNKEK